MWSLKRNNSAPTTSASERDVEAKSKLRQFPSVFRRDPKLQSYFRWIVSNHLGCGEKNLTLFHHYCNHMFCTMGAWEFLDLICRCIGKKYELFWALFSMIVSCKWLFSSIYMFSSPTVLKHLICKCIGNKYKLIEPCFPWFCLVNQIAFHWYVPLSQCWNRASCSCHLSWWFRSCK